MFTQKLLYGAAYYPEHWDKKLWARDARLMRDAGFNLVRVGEFAWWNFEPEEGVFRFDWLDEAIDLLDRHGMQVVIGTPTATIPAWLAARYPEVMALTDDGTRRRFGVRKDYCVQNPDFERLALRVVAELAKHYGRDRRVFGFQTDNEFGAYPSAACRCPLCLEWFRAFLKNRYGTIAALNKAWGTCFWGAVYNSFEEIGWPNPHVPSPSFRLDLKRYQSAVDVIHQAKQIAVLRALAPKKPVTHNFMGLYSDINYYDLAEDLDFVSWDNYPGSDTAGRFGEAALAHAVTWSMKEANFLVMEQQSGPGGWMSYSRQTAPGETAMLAWQAVARGADGISYFRWRTSVSGQEQYWHGILNHDNTPRRRYREVAALGKQLASLSRALVGTEPVAEVGLYYNYDQIWATEFQPQNGDAPVTFKAVVSDCGAALAGLGADFGVCGDGTADLSRYRVIVCPPLYLTDPELVAKLDAFVAQGGTLVLTAATGVKTLDNVCRMEPLPGAFRKLAGVAAVEEYDIVPKESAWSVAFDGWSFQATRLREQLVPAAGAEAVAVHRGAHFEGTPAVVRNRFGKGTVWYLGAFPDRDGWRELLQRVLAAADVGFYADLPAGVEICRRAGKGREFTFVINHSGEPRTVACAARTTDLLGGALTKGMLTLGAYGVAVLAGARKRRS